VSARPARTLGAPEAQFAAEPRARGYLVHEGRTLRVHVAAASTLSLRVAFDGVEAPPDRAVCEKLVLEVGGEIELSSCRYEAAPSDDGFAGRLVFLDDVYDVRGLLLDGRVVSFRNAARSLPLVLGKKEELRPEFRSFVADAMYDLSVWRKLFDDQERSLSAEPPDVAAAAREAMLRAQGPEFFAFFDRHILDLEELVRQYSSSEHERHGFYLRRQGWQFITASAFLSRTNVKPRGYAGDAEMMQMVYENRHVGPTAFGQLFHKHPIETAAAQAVRNRRKLVAAEVRAVQSRFPGLPRHGFSLFSVAVGPAWELHDIFRSREDVERMRCALLDQDPHALATARETVARIERTRGAPLCVEWFQDSVRTMLRAPRLSDRFGHHHLVYSMGLFDYLTTPVARATLSRLFELVVPGGALLVGNYHVAMPCRVYMEYWADWRLLYRDEQEMLALAADLPGARTSVEFDPSSCQMFLRVEKVA
jgi:extracellular factor (EF) 3-hydroxypalmitic acid methyl ester biosynthesis protein